ncbi:Tm-1-like ATP-binding domain-containing protein [Flaviflexus huanghaiensis]|uniref:Tm-1-like ATP-binding domain-containing protein n=1 Tax=Flaviflexus huanghaiensis TaxID=1111473 RepID=UPI0015F82A3D
MATVAIVGTFDTKGREFDFCRHLFEQQGVDTLMIHAGTKPASIPVDIDAPEVAAEGGAELSDLMEDRGRAMAAMTLGVTSIIPRLYEDGTIDGVFSLGGSGGTALATAGMRKLPVGVPKVMVSTMAGGTVAEYVGTSDIVMIPSIVDVQGLNSILQTILRNAVGAMVGMLSAEKVDEVAAKPHIAATMFGVTTPCVNRAQEILEARGYEVVVFHATGAGGKSMEQLIRDGYFVGVLDLTATEWCDELFGGILAAGPHRHEAAVDAGVPQVVSVGALDMVNFGSPDTVPAHYRGRNLYPHNPQITLMRTTAEENRQLGEKLAEKLNRATRETVVLLPLKGVSAIAVEGGPFYDRDADRALFEALEGNLDNEHVNVQSLDTDINDPVFAEAAAQALIELIEDSKGTN